MTSAPDLDASMQSRSSRSRGGCMSLSGNLSNFRFGDLLQTLAQNRQWGVLRLRRANETRQLSISERGIAHLDLLLLARGRMAERTIHQGYADSGDWLKCH